MIKTNVKKIIETLFCFMAIFCLFMFSACSDPKSSNDDSDNNNDNTYNNNYEIYTVIGTATPKQGCDVDFETALSETVEKIENILNNYVDDASVTILDGNKIKIEFSGDKNNFIKVQTEMLTPANIEFRLEENGEARITGKHVSEAYAFNSQGNWGVVIRFSEQGQQLFHQLTQDALNQTEHKIYIYSNGQEISEPTVESPINTGSTFISGSYDFDSADAFALQIMAGTFNINIAWGEITTTNNN